MDCLVKIWRLEEWLGERPGRAGFGGPWRQCHSQQGKKGLFGTSNLGIGMKFLLLISFDRHNKTNHLCTIEKGSGSCHVVCVRICCLTPLSLSCPVVQEPNWQKQRLGTEASKNPIILEWRCLCQVQYCHMSEFDVLLTTQAHCCPPADVKT